jgi:hypothetical protein
MTTAPLYVSRNLLNAEEVVRHFVDQGLPSVLAAKEMHVTVLYSKKPLRWEDVPEAKGGLTFPPMRGARGVGAHAVDRWMKRLGEHDVLTMVVQAQNAGAQRVIERNHEYRKAGASHDYPDVTVHVTISYACGDVDVATIKPFPGELRFGPEIREPIDKEWKPDLTKERTAKSVPALGCGCGPVHDACHCQTGGSGDFMTTVQTTNDAGYLTKAIGKILGRMTPSERTDMFKDAAVTAALEIGKAADLLEHPGVHHVEDLSDEPVGEMPRMPRAHGPGSSVAPGGIPVGPGQAATGGDAERMEEQYSRHAPQDALVRMTDELGRKVASHTRVMKGFMAFGKAMQDQLTILQSSTSLTPAAPDVAFVDAAIAKALPGAVALALAKAIPEVVRAVSKAKAAAEGEKEEKEEDEEEDKDDDEEESVKAESEVEREDKEEGEDEDEKDEAKKAMRKAAAVERLTAKSLLRVAKAESEEAEDAMEDGRHAAGKRHHKKAERRMEKASLHANVAKSLRGGKVGPSMTAIEKSLGSVAKALKDMKAKNQDKWPSHSKAGEAAKAAEVAAAAAGTSATPGANAEQIAKATAAVEKALSGMALLQADVQQVMAMVGGQSRNPGDGGRPPTDALFKAADLTLVGGKPEAQIQTLAQSGAINMAERDKAMDTLSTMKIPGMPQGMIDAAINACPAPVQAILRKAA